MSGKVERIGWAVRVEHLTGWRWYRNHGHLVWSDHDDAIDERDTNRVDGFPAEVWEVYAAPEGTIESLEAERDELRHEVTTLNEMGADLTRERDELRATVERVKSIAGGYVGSPCFSALLGEYDEDQGCGCPTCGHRAAFRALNPEEEG